MGWAIVIKRDDSFHILDEGEYADLIELLPIYKDVAFDYELKLVDLSSERALEKLSEAFKGNNGEEGQGIV